MVSVFGIDGKEVEKIELPKIFYQPVREDLILRAFLAIQSHKRQPYGPDKLIWFKNFCSLSWRKTL